MNQLCFQALLELTGSKIFSLLASKWRGVYLKSHGNRRLIHTKGRHSFNVVWITQGIRYIWALNTSNSNDVTSAGLLNLMALQPHITINQTNLGLVLLSIVFGYQHLLIWFYAPAGNTTNSNGTNIASVIQIGYLHLKRPIWVHIRYRTVLDNRFKQWGHIAITHFPIDA